MPERRGFWLKTWLRGFCMGSADVVPGVSGGTVALILGIYPRFIRALTLANLDLLRRLLRRDLRALVEHDQLFLLGLGAGIATAFLSLARIIPSLLQRHPAEMNGLFFGLILGSLVVPIRLIADERPSTGRRVALFSLGAVSAVSAYALTGLGILDVSPSLPFLFVCGAVAISAMLLPGVSGSFILLVLGQYEHLLDAIHRRDLLVIAVFGAGMVTGLLSFSRLLRNLLSRHPAPTLAVLAGLMAGSLRKIWPFRIDLGVLEVGEKSIAQSEAVWPLAPSYHGPLALPLALLLFGTIAVLILEHLGRRQAADAPATPGSAATP